MDEITEAKIIELHQALQLGLDAYERGEYIEVDMDSLEEYFAKLRP
ncbi:MAG: hypothetical protein QM523_04860 [Candidatus Pacebacteria bacterium]|nr:hypothetical protein [Candidatus Paceibacterota bacterium]